MMKTQWVPPKQFVKGSDVFPFDDPWDGRMLFTGPSGLGDFRAHLLKDPRPVGSNQYSRESTLAADYLWRPAPGTPFHKPRTKFVGEIGYYASCPWDKAASRTGHQIYTSEFWQQVEDVSTHRYQTPWYWHPCLGELPGHPERERPYGPTGYSIPALKRRCPGTSSGYRSASAGMVRSRSQPWRRAPDATQTTLYDGYTGDESSEQSDYYNSMGYRRVHGRIPVKKDSSHESKESGSGEDRGENVSANRPYTAPVPTGDEGQIYYNGSPGEGNVNANRRGSPYGENGRQSRAGHRLLGRETVPPRHLV